MKIATVHDVQFKMDDDLYEWYTRPRQMEVGSQSVWYFHTGMFFEMKSFQYTCERDQYPVFFDIGAHCGIFSFSYCSLVSQHKCYSIEPVRDHINRINAVANTNGFNISAHHLGFSDRSDVVIYEDPHMARWVNTETGEGHVDGYEMDTVKLITMDEFVKGNEAPSLVKIDTEGFEVPILRGAQHTLINHHPTLFIETHIEESRVLGHDIKEICDLIPSIYTFYTCDGILIKDLESFMFHDNNLRFVAMVTD